MGCICESHCLSPSSFFFFVLPSIYGCPEVSNKALESCIGPSFRWGCGGTWDSCLLKDLLLLIACGLWG